ncbi:hypothetical protein OC842_001488 [Tilletia horrida]|uniref:DUF3835 domain-containing protein n=1 Tax=Tilletia horrida TaxID=155126 RepID=A0AAN6JM73_9BASI|nr:hypothetical protein OC842_001488 [Tilletia horrida]
MTTVINEKNQIINEEGLPFIDPVEALAPGDPKAAANRPHGLVLPFVRSEEDRKRSKAERARWMDSVFDQLEAEEELELKREEEALEEQRAEQIERTRKEEEDDDDEDSDAAEEQRSRSVAKTSGKGKGKAATPGAGSQSSFKGIKKGFLNSKSAAPAITAPTGTLPTGAQAALPASDLQIKERATTDAHNAATPTATAPSSSNSSAMLSTSSTTPVAQADQVKKVKLPQRRVGFKSDLVQEKTIPARGEDCAPTISSRLRFEDLSLADEDDDDQQQTNDEEEEDADDRFAIDDDDEDDDDGADFWDDSDDEGYDSDDLRDLAPDLDADIDNAELAREYARARAGLLQSQALDAARREALLQENGRHGGEDIVPLDASISDPSVRTSTTHRVSRFRASRLARAVNDFDTLLHASKQAGPSSSAPAPNPLLVVPDLAPIRYPKNGDLLADPSQPGEAVLVDNVELEGESDEDDERLHEVMKARLAALEEQEEVGGVSKTVVERSGAGAGAGPTVQVGDGVGATGGRIPTPITPAGPSRAPLKVQSGANLAVASSPSSSIVKPGSAQPTTPGAASVRSRAPVSVQPGVATPPTQVPAAPLAEQPASPSAPTRTPAPAAAKEVRFAVEAEGQQGEPAEAPQPKVSRFKARKMAERGGQ